MTSLGRSADQKPARRLSRASRALLALAVIAPLAGCRLGKPDTRYDLLEAELRTRDREIEELRGLVGRNQLLDGTLARQPYPGAPRDLPPRPDVCDTGPFRFTGRTPTVPLKDISLASGTGGVDEDHLPGDEYLQVTIAPRDDDGTVVKVPMRAVVRAYEVSQEGLKTPIGQWDVSPDQMRQAWKSGLLSSGYFVPLQWDRLPTTGRLRLVARVATEDGREFEADKEVQVKPLPGHGSRPLPAPSPVIPTPRLPAPPVIGVGPSELPPPGTTLPPRQGETVVPLAPPTPATPPREELPPPARMKYRG